MQKSRGRQPETFMLFDSREAPHNDADQVCNPISIPIEQEAAIHRQIPHVKHQDASSHCRSIPNKTIQSQSSYNLCASYSGTNVRALCLCMKLDIGSF